jgi:hypothetical protein
VFFAPAGAPDDEVLVGVSVTSDCVARSVAAATFDATNTAWLSSVATDIHWATSL